MLLLLEVFVDVLPSLVHFSLKVECLCLVELQTIVEEYGKTSITFTLQVIRLGMLRITITRHLLSMSHPGCVRLHHLSERLKTDTIIDRLWEVDYLTLP